MTKKCFILFILYIRFWLSMSCLNYHMCIFLHYGFRYIRFCSEKNDFKIFLIMCFNSLHEKNMNSRMQDVCKGLVCVFVVWFGCCSCVFCVRGSTCVLSYNMVVVICVKVSTCYCCLWFLWYKGGGESVWVVCKSLRCV